MMRNFRNAFLIGIFIAASLPEEYYTIQDFDKVEKYDSHVHILTERNLLFDLAEEYQFKYINIAVTGYEMAGIKGPVDFVFNQMKSQNQIQYVITAFPMKDFDKPEWVANTKTWLESCFEKGAIGVKFHAIGLQFKDVNNNYIKLDHPKLLEIFEFLDKNKVPVSCHVGGPEYSWGAVEEMPTPFARRYFGEIFPENRNSGKDLPSYKELMKSQDEVLKRFPDLKYVGVHLASYESNLEELARRLEEHPNFYVDLSGRMDNLFLKSVSDYEYLRRFFIQYQDRIFYGTDRTDLGEKSLPLYGGGDTDKFKDHVIRTWKQHWEFLVTDNIIDAHPDLGKVKGIKLPRAVVDKIYRSNIENLYGLEW